jgi:glycosyltransferase involved in cell wall biosynthesis
MAEAMSPGSADQTTRPRLIVVGPVPPPTHGVAISTLLTLANPLLNESFEVEHADTTDSRSLSNIGAWDVTNVLLGIRHLAHLIRRLGGRKGVVYLPVSQNLGGFLRDSLFIHAAALRGWKVAVHLRGAVFRDFYEGSNAIVRWWTRRTLGRVSTLAVVGHRLRSIFDELMPPERIAVVPNGTPDVSRDNGARLPNRVVYLSNLVRDKGIVEAVEAALIVIARNPGSEVLFAGDWDDRSVERELRERVGPAGDRIRFLAPVSGEEKEGLLQSASVLLFPPKAPEGHPRVVLEAICRGIPLVTTNRGAIPETVADGESAFVLAEPDPTELAERILELLDDDDLRERMGRAARERYERDYTQETADRRLAEWLTATWRSADPVSPGNGNGTPLSPPREGSRPGK